MSNIAHFTPSKLSGVPFPADTSMYEALASLQQSVGYQATWTSLTEHVAYGCYRDADGHAFRIAVADVDGLTPLSALELADWVAGNIA